MVIADCLFINMLFVYVFSDVFFCTRDHTCNTFILSTVPFMYIYCVIHSRSQWYTTIHVWIHSPWSIATYTEDETICIHVQKPWNKIVTLMCTVS